MTPPPTEVFASRLFLGPALRAQPDRRLVTLVREGYEAAFEEIVRRHGRPLARYAASIVGSRSEDVTQDAFSKALQAMRRNENEIDLRPWLFRIVRNTALNDLRDTPPTPEILGEAIAAGRGTAAEAEAREELRELIDRLQALPERQRAAIVMRELEGLSHEEIAGALGLSGGAARQVIFRAREALRSGAGMLLPLPLLRLLLEHGTEATAGAGAGAAGMLAAGGTAGGAGTALKAGAVAVILAGSIGTGMALQQNHGREETADAAIIGANRGPDAGSGAPDRSAAGSAATAAGSETAGSGADHGGNAGGSMGGDSHGQNGGGDVTSEVHAGGHSGPGRSAGGGGDGSVGTSHGGPGPDGPRSSGPGGGGAVSGPVSGEHAESGDRHGGSSDDSSGSGGGGSDDNSGPGSGISGGSDGTDGGSTTTTTTTEEPAPAPDGSTSGDDGGSSISSGDGSGGELESGTEPSRSGLDGGGESASAPTS
jgi:RNA polymerase sigma factor (sigma-70 family)